MNIPNGQLHKLQGRMQPWVPGGFRVTVVVDSHVRCAPVRESLWSQSNTRILLLVIYGFVHFLTNCDLAPTASDNLLLNTN